MRRRLAIGFVSLVTAAIAVAVLLRHEPAIQAAPGDTVGDRVYGQFGSFTTNNQNCAVYTSINAGSLCAPHSITIDSAGRLWIADTYNHRVLEYDTPLTSSTATRVFGQAGSFGTGACNKNGISANSLCYPSGVTLDSGGNLYIADNSNHRVLEYDNPIVNDTTADRVFGQFNSFTTNTYNNGGTSANSLWHPSDVALDSAGNLFVSDRFNYRVLEYDTPLSSDTVADRVYGQFGSMTTGVLNNGGVSADSLSTLIGLAVDSANSLYVADDGNNRVLVYHAPLSDSTADFVFGQGGSFTSGAVNFGGIGAASLYVPTDIVVDGAGNVYISETGNERTLGYNNPFGTDDVADVVFGQGGSFTAFGNNSIGLNASSVADPWSVTIDAACHLWIAELGNNRALEFDSPPPGCTVYPAFTPTSTACPVPLCTATPTPTSTSTPLSTDTPTETPTCEPNPMVSCTPTPTPTGCDIPFPPGCTDTPTPTPTCGGGPIACDTETPTPTPTCGAPFPPGCSPFTPTPTPSCPSGVYNSDSEYFDTEYPPNSGTVVASGDATNPHQDPQYDPCDQDDDNDDLSDPAELIGCNGSGALDPLDFDSDNDLFPDGYECVVGTNPASAGSRPPYPPTGARDSDEDGLLDSIEIMIQTFGGPANFDGGACGDARENASVNLDSLVNSADLSAVAMRFGPYRNTTAGQYTPGPAGTVVYARQVYDFNRDGTISSADLSAVAQRFVSASASPC